MSHPESGKVSYIRAFHEIEASSSAETLLAYASELLIAESFVDPRDPQQRVPRPNVYPASSLRTTVFEGYAPAGDSDTNALLRALQHRLESPELETINRSKTNYSKRTTEIKLVENPLMTTLRSTRSMYLTEKVVQPENPKKDDQQGNPEKDDQPENSKKPPVLDMTVSANSIVVSTKEQYQGHGTQLALKIDTSNVAEFLVAESGAYITQAKKIVFARRLAWLDDAEAALLVPILTAPFRSETQTKEFIEQLGAKLPVVSLDVGQEVAWTNTSRKSA